MVVYRCNNCIEYKQLQNIKIYLLAMIDAFNELHEYNKAKLVTAIHDDFIKIIPGYQE